MSRLGSRLWQTMVEQAKLVEALGFDKLWLPDHFVAPTHPEAPWYECWTSDKLFHSMEAFHDTIGRYREAGIHDFCFGYAPGLDFWKEKAITTSEMLQQIAPEAIPRLRQVA